MSSILNNFFIDEQEVDSIKSCFEIDMMIQFSLDNPHLSFDQIQSIFETQTTRESQISCSSITIQFEGIKRDEDMIKIQEISTMKQKKVNALKNIINSYSSFIFRFERKFPRNPLPSKKLKNLKQNKNEVQYFLDSSQLQSFSETIQSEQGQIMEKQTSINSMSDIYMKTLTNNEKVLPSNHEIFLSTIESKILNIENIQISGQDISTGTTLDLSEQEIGNQKIKDSSNTFSSTQIIIEDSHIREQSLSNQSESFLNSLLSQPLTDQIATSFTQQENNLIINETMNSRLMSFKQKSPTHSSDQIREKRVSLNKCDIQEIEDEIYYHSESRKKCKAGSFQKESKIFLSQCEQYQNQVHELQYKPVNNTLIINKQTVSTQLKSSSSSGMKLLLDLNQPILSPLQKSSSQSSKSSSFKSMCFFQLLSKQEVENQIVHVYQEHSKRSKNKIGSIGNVVSSFKRFMKDKVVNKQNVFKLLTIKTYSKLLQFYLIRFSSIWLESCQVQDKTIHQIVISFLIRCCDQPELINKFYLTKGQFQ